MTDTIHLKLQQKLEILRGDMDGEFFFGMSDRLMYATDASAYRELPLAVAYPKNKDDIKKLIRFAKENKTSLIPRTAGTSLAGQVVGYGIVVDVSKHMTRILEINKDDKWVRVEPGVILDELNLALKEHGLFFGPETSTSNRCMMGGMLGNNACGAHSLVYGSTRDHTIEVKTLLSDGNEALFGPLNKSEFIDKCKGDTLESQIYRNISDILNKPENREQIEKEYPDPEIKRRNTGYAIDLLLNAQPFLTEGDLFNFSKILAGSEGTLAFTTEIKLNLVELPPKHKALVCVHLDTVEDALQANLIALKHKPVAIELMDKAILDLTKENIAQNKNRFFIKGDPGAILIIEFVAHQNTEIHKKVQAMEKEMRSQHYGFHFPVIVNTDIPKVWALRKAGLGVLSNMKGDAKPVAVVEDTAVNPKVLPEYIKEFVDILKKYNKDCVYHAHIATGELHLRPILDLKDPRDVQLFHQIAKETAHLVKKYKGSLSGEHGDGRLRGEFIPIMIGEHNYQLLKDLKNTWDPDHIFNPGKIVDTPVMNTSLRYQPGQPTKEIETVFDFSNDLGIIRSAEKCNGAGACRKTELVGGTMCPSYMATRDEKHSTRARANILREFLTHSAKKNPFDHKEIYDVMALCLSCKACKSECPSSVDVAKLKAEFLQHYYDEHGIPLRSKVIAHISSINLLGSYFPGIYNFVNQNPFLARLNAGILGFSKKRKFPLMSGIRLEKWLVKNSKITSTEFPNGKVYLFNDEFTRFNDTDIGIKTILLLNKLGYKVVIPKHLESARTFLSKGLVRRAKQIANQNVALLNGIITSETPLVGIEPSAILTFRDEYPELVDVDLKDKAKKLAFNTFMIDEFLEKEMKSGHIKKEAFTSEKKQIKLHGHCQQKAIASTAPTLYILNYPENYITEEIPSGCCGMAGSFGFEKEHYDVSMKIGELVLFPEVRKTDKEVLIAATGTSCRHQIKDGTERRALHPAEILYEALRK
ncbi:MAG: FAD-linked oxidase C-terminal domain-containing protein [Bacteroidales bacterium]|nr:FAD-linked oxidase C-terminal domain-containing protein [Bacteroidales bacterium]